MKAEAGLIVKATAGKEADGFYVIVACGESEVWLADGKRRALSKPKRKNIKHLQLTGTRIDLTALTDKKLRNVLRAYANTITE